MGLATEQLSQQLLEYEKKVSGPEDFGLSPSFLSSYINFLTSEVLSSDVFSGQNGNVKYRNAYESLPLLSISAWKCVFTLNSTYVYMYVPSLIELLSNKSVQTQLISNFA